MIILLFVLVKVIILGDTIKGALNFILCQLADLTLSDLKYV